MSASPGRRWFAFRLRTLFVLVAALSIPLAWVAYSLNWIRERHAILNSAGELGFCTEDYHLGKRTSPDGLWLFGEPGILWVDLPLAPVVPVERVRRLFPEASVFFSIETDFGEETRSYGPPYAGQYARMLYMPPSPDELGDPGKTPGK